MRSVQYFIPWKLFYSFYCFDAKKFSDLARESTFNVHYSDMEFMQEIDLCNCSVCMCVCKFKYIIRKRDHDLGIWKNIEQYGGYNKAFHVYTRIPEGKINGRKEQATFSKVIFPKCWKTRIQRSRDIA